jgi:hypothetical protein
VPERLNKSLFKISPLFSKGEDKRESTNVSKLHRGLLL